MLCRLTLNRRSVSRRSAAIALLRRDVELPLVLPINAQRQNDKRQQRYRYKDAGYASAAFHYG
jgi:hypothetical protein